MKDDSEEAKIEEVEDEEEKKDKKKKKVKEKEVTNEELNRKERTWMANELYCQSLRYESISSWGRARVEVLLLHGRNVCSARPLNLARNSDTVHRIRNMPRTINPPG